jgi:hypothetical protein
MLPFPSGTASLSRLQGHAVWACHWRQSPAICKPRLPALSCVDEELKTVLIPWSIQETSLSFRPRWLSSFYRFLVEPSREFREAKSRYLPRPLANWCPGNCPRRDFANKVFREMARKDAARSHRHTVQGEPGKIETASSTSTGA